MLTLAGETMQEATAGSLHPEIWQRPGGPLLHDPMHL